MNTTIDPNDAARAWTSRRDAVAALEAMIAEADTTLAGRPVVDAYDVDAIADEVLTTQGAGHLYRFVLAVEDEDFWAAMAHSSRSTPLSAVPSSVSLRAATTASASFITSPGLRFSRVHRFTKSVTVHDVSPLSRSDTRDFPTPMDCPTERTDSPL